MILMDDIHYSYRNINGYNKPFNFIFGVREVGKTATIWMEIYNRWKITKKPIIYLVRKSVEICEALINSIADTTINKFTDDNIKLTYTKGSFKDGITDVYIGEDLFFRIVSLNIDLRRIKLAVLKNIQLVLMDEYIIDPETKEKYLPNEAFKIKEAYTTWRREADGVLKCYFLGNPYSLFNPLFIDWNVNVNKLKIGEFYVGDTFVIHWCSLNPILLAKLKEANPLYQEGSEYSLYALKGQAINDSHIPLGVLPQNYILKYIFKLQNYYLGVFQNKNFDIDNKYFIKQITDISKRRNVYCFEFSDMVKRTQLISLEDRWRMMRFKEAIMKNKVTYNSINDYYYLMEVYKNL